MSAGTLGHYFRSFLVKLSMLEAQLGNLAPGGKGLALMLSIKSLMRYSLDEASFAIALELKDNRVPSAPRTTVKLGTQG